MKIRIFNKGKGWYISASNYKDKTDKAYMNVHFVKGTEPLYDDFEGKGWLSKDIEILEGVFSSYHSTMGLTIFKYKIINSPTPPDGEEIAKALFSNVRVVDDNEVNIEQEQLPFY